MKLRLRMATRADDSALIAFWSEHSGWDQLDLKMWRHRFVDTPLGESYIVIAEQPDSGELVGQFVFFPSLVAVDGVEVPAARAFAPIVSSGESRGRLSLNPLDHPIAQMYKFAVQELAATGVGVIYSLPDPRWLPFLRFFKGPNVLHGAFRLWSQPLPLEEQAPVGDGFAIEAVEPGDDEIDELWRRALTSYRCLVIRDTRTLSWKLSHGDFSIMGIRRDGNLVGLVASQRKGDRQQLICDMITVDDSECLRATVTAATNLAHELSTEAADSLAKVGVLATPKMQPVLSGLGYSPDDYRFPLIVRVLDSELDRAAVSPDSWYVSAND